MEKDLLGEVIEVEKELQKCLEQERIRSREWLEQAGKEFEEEAAQEEALIRRSADRSREQAEQDAAARAAEIVMQAERLAARLGTLRNDSVSRIVKDHLRMILPE